MKRCRNYGCMVPASPNISRCAEHQLAYRRRQAQDRNAVRCSEPYCNCQVPMEEREMSQPLCRAHRTHMEANQRRYELEVESARLAAEAVANAKENDLAFYQHLQYRLDIEDHDPKAVLSALLDYIVDRKRK